MDRSHQVGVQCTWTVTLACLSFESLPFVYFHTWFLSGAYLENYTSYGYEILWMDRSHQWGVQCTWTITLACLIFELLPFVFFHTCFLSGAHLQDYAIYSYEISWVGRSHQGGVQCKKKKHNSPLLNFWAIALCLFSYLIFVLYFYTWFLSRAYLKNLNSYGYKILWVDRSHQGGVQCTWTVTLA